VRSSPPGRVVQLATFKLAAGEYALDIMRIKEIIQPQRITPVPKVPAFLEGVIELRGNILPVIDLRKRFELPAPPATRATKYAIEGRIVGLVVDAVGEVLRVAESDVRAPPALEGDAGHYFAGVCRHGGRILFIIDMDRVLSSSEKISLARLSSFSLAPGPGEEEPEA
jgi:purine-binding chemotaxis protein CheW